MFVLVRDFASGSAFCNRCATICNKVYGDIIHARDNELYGKISNKTTILVATTNAFRAIGELDGQLRI